MRLTKPQKPSEQLALIPSVNCVAIALSLSSGCSPGRVSGFLTAARVSSPGVDGGRA
jgi:hypothetical protein